MKKILYFLSLSWLDKIIKDSVDNGILDFSGQGKNMYGR